MADGMHTVAAGLDAHVPEVMRCKRWDWGESEADCSLSLCMASSSCRFRSATCLSAAASFTSASLLYTPSAHLSFESATIAAPWGPFMHIIRGWNAPTDLDIY